MCAPNSTFPVTIRGASSVTVQQVVGCVQGLQFWRNSSSDTNDELYKVFRKGNSGREINEIIAGYDLLNSDVSICRFCGHFSADFLDLIPSFFCKFRWAELN
ncbi:ABC transporter A family member 8-like [Apium graveolens]|uniref:ABC transporter A family member 8-like n=1 Tax=Apium graveolens TaxID=4045 RepID=UPI003D78DE92